MDLEWVWEFVCSNLTCVIIGLIGISVYFLLKPDRRFQKYLDKFERRIERFIVQVVICAFHWVHCILIYPQFYNVFYEFPARILYNRLLSWSKRSHWEWSPLWCTALFCGGIISDSWIWYILYFDEEWNDHVQATAKPKMKTNYI